MLERLDPSRLLAARRLGEEMGALSTVAVLDLQLAATYTGRWDLENCDVHARAAVARARRLGLDVVAGKGLALLMGSASMRGDVEGTRQWAAQAAAATPDDPVLHGFAQASVGLALFLAGRKGEALGPLDGGTATLGALSGVDPMSVRALWPLIQAAEGDDRAAETIRQARASGVEAFHGNAGLLLLAEAVLAGRLGQPASAEELAARAWDESHHTGRWRELARLIAASAARADGWGDPDAWEASATAALAGLRLVTGPTQNLWADAGVTDREAEVLHLVMTGLANKEIAARLHLSVRTVEKHLESLRRKTGSRTRTELAISATRPTT